MHSNFVFLLILLFSPLCKGSACSSLLELQPVFLIEGRVITVALSDLTKGKYSLFNSTHTIYIKQELHKGMMEAAFVDQMVELEANLRLNNMNTEKHLASGVLKKSKQGLWFFEIERLWKKDRSTESLELSDSPVIIYLRNKI